MAVLLFLPLCFLLALRLIQFGFYSLRRIHTCSCSSAITNTHLYSAKVMTQCVCVCVCDILYIIQYYFEQDQRVTFENGRDMKGRDDDTIKLNYYFKKLPRLILLILMWDLKSSFSLVVNSDAASFHTHTHCCVHGFFFLSVPPFIPGITILPGQMTNVRYNGIY